MFALLSGCNHLPLLDPKGPVGSTEKHVIIAAFVFMLIVVLPVHFMTLLFTRRYRASNQKARYTPKWNASGKIDLVVWLVPIAIVTVLGYLAWKETHTLDPYKAVVERPQPINVEVISSDWKWLFIYPDHDIAVVNQLVFPANIPLSFRTTLTR